VKWCVIFTFYFLFFIKLNIELSKIIKTALTLTIPTIILFGFAMPLNPVGNWYQQFMPNLGGQQINDIVFLDSLIGYAVSSKNINPDTSSILKTTDGGDSWQIVLTQTPKRFSRVKFINQNTGFVCGGTGGGTTQLYKTINAGTNWFLLSSFGCAFWNDMYVLNDSTIWLVDANSLCGGVFFTSTGGSSWVQQFSGGNQNPNKIYMYNARIGFMSNNSASPNIYRTTNGGANWNINVSGQYCIDVKFADSSTGWYSHGNFVYKTTNSGGNWVQQILPSGGIILNTSIFRFSVLSKDTVWGGGGQLFYGSGRFRAMLYRTINGGTNWLFTIPDTSLGIPALGYIQFINRNTGWAYNSYLGIHTTTGGDPVWLTGIEQTSSEIPKEFKLFQNYPNPFNPNTNIGFRIADFGLVTLKIYDLTGREIVILINEEFNAGEYKTNWNAASYSSGVYFYKLTVTTGKEVFTETKRMVLIK
jgi:hypothetical protein